MATAGARKKKVPRIPRIMFARRRRCCKSRKVAQNPFGGRVLPP
jgi:hypothetical protein